MSKSHDPLFSFRSIRVHGYVGAAAVRQAGLEVAGELRDPGGEREGVKRIVEVLELAKSSYLAPFQKLSQLIEEGRTEAVDNLKFLENLNLRLSRVVPRVISS